MENNKCVTIRQITRDEARKIYAQKSKDELIDMLIACNEALDAALLAHNNPIYLPAVDYNQNCSDWAHCPNPHRDCINCPLRGYGGGYGGSGGWSTSTSTNLMNENEQ